MLHLYFQAQTQEPTIKEPVPIPEFFPAFTGMLPLTVSTHWKGCIAEPARCMHLSPPHTRTQHHTCTHTKHVHTLLTNTPVQPKGAHIQAGPNAHILLHGTHGTYKDTQPHVLQAYNMDGTQLHVFKYTHMCTQTWYNYAHSTAHTYSHTLNMSAHIHTHIPCRVGVCMLAQTGHCTCYRHIHTLHRHF